MPSRFLFEPPQRKSKAKVGLKSLLVRCPSTSKLTDTGRTIDEKLWPAAKVKGQRLTCAHCGKVHNWEKADVVLGRPTS
jgi:hypothetical protein